MNPTTIDLFTLALGLEKPWTCTNVEFMKDAGRLDLWIDFQRGSRFTCPECSAKECAVHDTVDKEWRHMNFFQHVSYLHARVPRVRCDECGVHLVHVPWARPGSGFTLLFEALVMSLVEHMPVSDVAKIVSEHDTLLWRILQHYVGEARENETMEEVCSVGIDETASARGHRYVSVFVDMASARVLFATPGKDSSTVEAFAADLTEHGGAIERITNVCSDMSPAFIDGVRRSLPYADITFDRFHVMQLASVAVDTVRREEQKTWTPLKKTRYIWLKNPSSLKSREAATLHSLSKTRLKTVRAYHLRLSLRELWNQKDADAETFLQRWYAWAIRSRLEPMVELARMVRRHWDGILRSITTGLTNAVVEGINSIIQLVRTRARGFRSMKNFITMIYLVVGKLHFDLPT